MHAATADTFATIDLSQLSDVTGAADVNRAVERGNSYGFAGAFIGGGIGSFFGPAGAAVGAGIGGGVGWLGGFGGDLIALARGK
jgi:hypothetical protein